MPRATHTLLFAALLLAALSDPGTGQVPPATIRIVIHSNLFAGVNVRDAEAAIALWARALSGKMATGLELSFALSTDREGCLRTIASGEADVIGLSGVDYVRHRQELPADPMLVGVWGEEERATDEFVLLARSRNGPRQLADLSGRVVTIGTVDDGTTAAMWLDVLLMREGLPPADSHLTVRTADTPSHCLVGTLFGQDDACVVTRRSFETMAELNPQVGRELTVLAASPGYLDKVACYRRGGDPQVRDRLIRTATSLASQPLGRQILDLFRCDRAAEFAAHHLAATEELVEEHQRLTHSLSP